MSVPSSTESLWFPVRALQVVIDRCSLGPLSPVLSLAPTEGYVKNRILRINARLLAGPAKCSFSQGVLDCDTLLLSDPYQGTILFCVQLSLSNLPLHDTSM